MKLCFPVVEVSALDSKVYGHFGSAPKFILVDSETENFKVIDNVDQHHIHGMCNPIESLAGLDVGSVIVGGIGGGALTKLNIAGISVYKAMAKTVKENLALFSSGRLPRFQPGHTCTGNSQACSH